MLKTHNISFYIWLFCVIAYYVIMLINIWNFLGAFYTLLYYFVSRNIWVKEFLTHIP